MCAYGIDTDFQGSGGITNTSAVEGHIDDLRFDSRLSHFIAVGKLKYAMAITTAKSVVSLWVLTMAINLSGLTTGAMNINTDHSRISKSEHYTSDSTN